MTDTIVSSLSAAYSAYTTLPDNDRVLLADGTYNQSGTKSLTKNATGYTTFRAQNIGGAILTGDPIELNSDKIIFEGFDIQWSKASGNYGEINANNCIFRRNKVHLGNGTGTQHWQVVLGNNNIINNNEFYSKATQGNMLLVGSSDAIVTGTQVYKNHFHDQTTAGSGGETLRVGSSETAWIDFSSNIYLNLFERCDGDPEMLCIKSSYNNIHHNTILNCNASLSLRHGNFNKVEDNYIKNTGFRFFGHGHSIKRNQILEDSRNQLRGHMVFLNGDQQDDVGAIGTIGAPNNQHAQVYDCIIEDNVIMAKNATSLIIFCFGFNGATVNPDYKPLNNQILNNIITGSTGTLAKANDGASWTGNTVSGNILNATGTATLGDMPTTGYTTHAHNLVEKADGTYRCCSMLTPLMVGPFTG